MAYPKTTISPCHVQRRSSRAYVTMTIHFADCESGTVRYDLPGTGVSGAVPIRRIVTDLVPLCGALKTPTAQ